jgi:hypothetical protein
VHSHEEDTDGEMVFRPSRWSFPPSRGRISFELRSDGTYVETSPGEVDAPKTSSGTWSLEGDRLILAPHGDGSGHAWHVTSVSGDRLVVKS